MMLILTSMFKHRLQIRLSDLLTVYTPSRQLRCSADTRTLRTLHVRTNIFVQRCYSYWAPKQWNSLPSDIRHIQSSYAFQAALKTHLHKQHNNKWFKWRHLTCLPLPLPSLHSFGVPVYVCVCVCVGGGGLRGIQYYDYVSITFEVLMYACLFTW